jgi:hypothetical protein
VLELLFVATRTVDTLRRGARIHSLLYAAHLSKNPDRKYDVTWEGHHYRRSDVSGARGTVTFSKHGVVGVFFDPKSPRAPAPGKKQKKLEEHFVGIPAPLLALAKRETLATMDDGVGPVVTAAIWSMPDGELVGARPWPRLGEDGAHLVELELGKPEASILAWALRYALAEDQAAAARETFPTKGNVPASNAKVTLSDQARAALRILTNQATRELLEGAQVNLG